MSSDKLNEIIKDIKDIIKELEDEDEDLKKSDLTEDLKNKLNKLVDKYEPKETELEKIFNSIFPGKSNGRIIRLSKLYAVVKDSALKQHKEEIKKQLLKLNYIIEHKNKNQTVYYYNKEHFEEFKKWIIEHFEDSIKEKID
jgi:hypothetical protein